MKKIGLLALALVLALGTLGVGYALWFEDLVIEGTVMTGTLDVDWSQGVPYDTEPDGKDVSYGVCFIEGNTLSITIYDAYPCIEYHFPIDIHGVGSVPAHLCPLVIISSDLPSGASVTFPDWSDVQLHQGDEEVGEIVVHLDNTADENTTYSFTAVLRAHQYNEDGDCASVGLPK
jgi:hypothetical protein